MPPGPATVTRSRLGLASSLLGWMIGIVTCGFIAMGAWLQANVHLNHDVAWIAHTAGWMLDGLRFGSDIVDVNPPLPWFVALPVPLLERWTGMTTPTAVILYTFTLCTLGLWLAHRMLHTLARQPGQAVESTLLLVVAAAVLILLPEAAFGQREHLAFALGLPYMALAMSRLSLPQAVVPRSEALLVGLVAGVAFALKPYLLAVPAALELLGLFRERNLARVLRPETVGLAITVIAYLGAIAVFTPDYLTVALPLARATYWAYEATDLSKVLATVKDAAWPAVLAVAILLSTRSFRSRHAVMVTVILACSASYLVQMKGFKYHAFPVLAGSMTLLGMSVAAGIQGLREASWLPGARARLMAGALVALLGASQVPDAYDSVRGWYSDYHPGLGRTGSLRQLLIDRIDARTRPRGDYFYALSTHPFPAFPTGSYTHAEWGGRMVAQWILPAYAKRDRIADPELRADIVAAAEYQRRLVIEDLERHRPSVVIVNLSFSRLGLRHIRFNDLDFYAEDPRFAALWSDYREIERVGPFRMFVRQDMASPRDRSSAAGQR